MKSRLLENFPNVIAHLRGDKTRPLSESDKEAKEIIDKLDEKEMRGLLRILNEGEEFKEIIEAFKKVMLKKLIELEIMKI